MSVQISMQPIENLDEIKSLWEAIRDDHATRSTYFGNDFRGRRFENRFEFYKDADRVKYAGLCVARDDSRIIGYCAGHIDYQGIGEIDSFYVVPEYRSQGIGHLIFERLHTELSARHPTKIHIAVIHGNERALQFYKRHGFLPIGYKLQNIPNDESDLLTYTELAPADMVFHEQKMRKALYWAVKAESLQEAPIGCVIVHDGRIIAHGYNLRESRQDVTEHAEISAIRSACRKLKSWRLENCDLYVTLEPCTMCAGAIIQSRIRHVYFGAPDPKAGAVVSKQQVFDAEHNHQVQYTGGILADECGQILKDFFKTLRKEKPSHQE